MLYVWVMKDPPEVVDITNVRDTISMIRKTVRGGGGQRSLVVVIMNIETSILWNRYDCVLYNMNYLDATCMK